MLHWADSPNNIKCTAIAFTRHRQIDPCAEFEVFAVADLDYAAGEVVVFVNKINFLVATLFRTYTIILSQRQLLEHARTRFVNHRA